MCKINQPEIIIETLSIDKVAQKTFLLQDVPTKPLVSSSCFNYMDLNLIYKYQVDIAFYLPIEVTTFSIKKWTENELCISPTIFPDKKNDSEEIGTSYRQLTILFDEKDQFLIDNYLSLVVGDTLKTLEFNLYTIQLKYKTDLFIKDLAKSIFVNYTYGDPKTTRGTVTTVRDISEKTS